MPTDMVKEACSILTSAPYDEVYQQCPYDEPIQLHSLLHTFPQFRLKGYRLWFSIFPAQDCHFVCEPSNFEWSSMGLPYPKLDVFAQSLLDTCDLVGLTDLVDGMDLTEEWGSSNLDLSGTTDAVWARQKNEKIRASVPLTMTSCLLQIEEGPFKTIDLFKDIVETKKGRIGPEMGENLTTRFRREGSSDPRLAKRVYA